ncbi:hypothetical protein JYT34_01410 [Olleya sp. AH-315-K02]|nr:hypothetical protein [bacterium AH-315-P13]MBN4058076.1 hypothetical protein [Olleya sp. AH-315-K02]
MKKILIIISILSVGFSFSQASVGTSGFQTGLNYSIKQYGTALMSYNLKNQRQTDGTFYLFDQWSNEGIIHTEDNKRYKIGNININLERHSFESKAEGDSIFIFNFNNINKFVINGITYKNYYWEEDNQIYEVIYDNNDFQILKGFRVLLITTSPNPMLNRSRAKYIRKSYYCLRKDDKIKPFRLKKSHILKLINEDANKANMIEAYARNNSLSFKKEKDVQMILEYSAAN